MSSVIPRGNRDRDCRRRRLGREMARVTMPAPSMASIPWASADPVASNEPPPPQFTLWIQGPAGDAGFTDVWERSLVVGDHWWPGIAPGVIAIAMTATTNATTRMRAGRTYGAYAVAVLRMSRVNPYLASMPLERRGGERQALHRRGAPPGDPPARDTSLRRRRCTPPPLVITIESTLKN